MRILVAQRQSINGMRVRVSWTEPKIDHKSRQTDRLNFISLIPDKDRSTPLAEPRPPIRERRSRRR